MKKGRTSGKVMQKARLFMRFVAVAVACAILSRDNVTRQNCVIKSQFKFTYLLSGLSTHVLSLCCGTRGITKQTIEN